jgi:hypothetical protein
MRCAVYINLFMASNRPLGDCKGLRTDVRKLHQTKRLHAERGLAPPSFSVPRHQRKMFLIIWVDNGIIVILPSTISRPPSERISKLGHTGTVRRNQYRLRQSTVKNTSILIRLHQRDRGKVPHGICFLKSVPAFPGAHLPFLSPTAFYIWHFFPSGHLILSRPHFVTNHNSSHVGAVQKIISYLRGTLIHGIAFTGTINGRLVAKKLDDCTSYCKEKPVLFSL